MGAPEKREPQSVTIEGKAGLKVRHVEPDTIDLGEQRIEFRFCHPCRVLDPRIGVRRLDRCPTASRRAAWPSGATYPGAKPATLALCARPRARLMLRIRQRAGQSQSLAER